MEEKNSHKQATSAFQRVIFLVGAAGVLLLIGIISASLFREGKYSHKDAARLEQVLHKKEAFLKEEFSELEELVFEKKPTRVLDQLSNEYQELSNRAGDFSLLLRRQHT